MSLLVFFSKSFSIRNWIPWDRHSANGYTLPTKIHKTRLNRNFHLPSWGPCWISSGPWPPVYSSACSSYTSQDWLLVSLQTIMQNLCEWWNRKTLFTKVQFKTQIYQLFYHRWKKKQLFFSFALPKTIFTFFISLSTTGLSSSVKTTCCWSV